VGLVVRARVTIRGSLAYVETELRQKAVVPLDTLCSLVRDFNLELEDPSVLRLCSKRPVQEGG
jgi:hypothetical protein